jgi:hypothetical protein
MSMMPVDDSGMGQELRIRKAEKPSKEQVLQLAKLPRREFYPAAARLTLFPENPTRKAYTALREIYLAFADAWWDLLSDSAERPVSKEHFAQVTAAQEKMSEVMLWLRKPDPPLTLDAALKIVEGSKSEFWRTSVMSQVGKRRRPGQPALKRYLALQALDVKCAYPDMSLREVTDELCPCGKDKHTLQCREQLRQQIKRLVKFLKQYGHDFTWDHIK